MDKVTRSAMADAGARAVVRGVHIVMEGAIKMESEMCTGVVFGVAGAQGQVAARAQVERCEMYGDEAAGVNVVEGARVAIVLCRVLCGVGGVMVDTGRGRADVARCEIAGITCCKVLSPGCVLRVRGCDLQNMTGGSFARDGGALMLVDSVVQGSDDSFHGLIVALQYGAVTLLHCRLERAAMGVQVVHGTARVVDTRVWGMAGMQNEHVMYEGLELSSGVA